MTDQEIEEICAEFATDTAKMMLNKLNELFNKYPNLPKGHEKVKSLKQLRKRSKKTVRLAEMRAKMESLAKGKLHS